jgi:amidophosphoribosyltransferase
MQGVIGVYSGDNAIQKALNNLYGVQHRGQESAGMSAAGDNSLRTWKGKGLVSNVFRELFRSFMHPNDYVVIGCASGENASKGSLPPIEYESDRYRLSLTLDGHVQNKGSRLNEEIVGSLIMEKLQEGDGIDIAIGETMKEIHNAYFSMVAALLDKYNRRSELIAARDSRGIRPLYLAMNEDELFVASESAPIDVMESMGQRIEERRDIKPGSLVRRNDDGLTERQLVDPQYAHCAFEWVYFGRPDSIIEGRNVHSVRKRLGQALVETYSLKTTYGIVEGPRKDIVVIPIPDSGRSVCVGVAEALGVTADEGVIKNAYLGRTYIIDDPEFRRIASDLKHNIIKETVRGKKVIITDDSIVRGTVSESVAKNLIKAGAAEVEYLISYAPIYHPCFSDPPDKPLAAAPYEGRCLAEIGELVASNLPSINEVRYNSPENVIDAIGLPSGRLCTYCVTGENPLIKTRAPEIAIRDSSLGK